MRWPAQRRAIVIRAPDLKPVPTFASGCPGGKDIASDSGISANRAGYSDPLYLNTHTGVRMRLSALNPALLLLLKPAVADDLDGAYQRLKVAQTSNDAASVKKA